MNNIMSTSYGAIHDLVDISMLPAVLNMDSTGTLTRLTARKILAISGRIG